MKTKTWIERLFPYPNGEGPCKGGLNPVPPTTQRPPPPKGQGKSIVYFKQLK